MSSQSEKASAIRTKAAIAIGVVVLLVVAGCGGDDDGATSTADPAETTPTSTESSSVEPTKVTAPQVTGLSLSQAVKRLRARGLRVGTVSKRPSAKPRRTVLRQSDRPGSRLNDGSSVSLVIAAPLPLVPNTIGDDRFAAKRKIRRAGFTVRTTKQQTDSASPGTVIDQTPDGGTRARPGATVTITIAKKPPAPPPTEEDNCTAGYSPCLPPASDYDCAGGSGDGPAYADGPIYVTGSDPYGLDSDSDGVACET